jgi:hypothetical protein
MWNPDPNTIGGSEVLGRRVFTDKPFVGPGGRVPERYFNLDIFFDTRLKDDLSFDRLGEGSPAKAVRKFLTPLADAEAASMRPPRPFSGWAPISMKRLGFVKVTPVPTKHPFNPFHAELSRALYRDKTQAETLAFRLAVEAGTDLVPPVG